MPARNAFTAGGQSIAGRNSTMSIGRILFLAIFLFCASLLVTTTSFLQNLASQYLADPSSLKAVEQARQEQAYQDQLLSILKNYGQGKALVKEKNYQQLEAELLALTVPSAFRDLHWQLVQALENFNQGLTENTRQALEALIKKYSWLSTVLSSFIINNFS